MLYILVSARVNFNAIFYNFTILSNQSINVFFIAIYISNYPSPLPLYPSTMHNPCIIKITSQKSMYTIYTSFSKTSPHFRDFCEDPKWSSLSGCQFEDINKIQTIDVKDTSKRFYKEKHVVIC
jgi:hypothetical protein